MNVLFEIVRQSLATLWAHKLRSFLTMFGIAWGVGSLLLLVGLGEGFRSGQVRNLATLGQDIMFIFPGRIPAVAGSLQSGQTYHFTYEDYVAIRKEARTLRALSPVVNREDIRAVSDYGSTNGQVFGVSPEYNQIRTVPVGTGRWLNDEDNTEHRRVAVVGWELLKNVFPGRPAVGATMLLNGIRFDVIGVLAKVGKDGNNGTNARIFVPVETMRNLFPLKQQNSEGALSFINYRPLNKAAHLQSKEEIHQIIARRHGFDPKLEDAFEDWDTIENSQRVDKIFDAMDYFLGSGGLRDPGAGRDWNRQHHAGLGGGAHPGDRPAQGAGRHLQKYSDPVLHRGRIPDPLQRRNRALDLHGLCHAAGPVARAAGIRHATHRAHVGRGRHLVAGHSRRCSWNLSRREKPRCWPRSKP